MEIEKQLLNLKKKAKPNDIILQIHNKITHSDIQQIISIAEIENILIQANQLITDYVFIFYLNVINQIVIQKELFKVQKIEKEEQRKQKQLEKQSKQLKKNNPTAYLLDKYKVSKQKEEDSIQSFEGQKSNFDASNIVWEDYQLKLIIIYINKEIFEEFTNLQQVWTQLQAIKNSIQTKEQIKFLVIFENVKSEFNELKISERFTTKELPETNIFCSCDEIEFSEWLINLNIELDIDYKLTESLKESQKFFFACFSTLANSKYKSKLRQFDHKGWQFTEKTVAAGITNFYSQQWVNILMAIPGISEEKSIAIVKKYPTFKSLQQAYNEQNSLEEKESMLQQIIVHYDNRQQSFGKALSKKIYQVFSAADGNQKLIQEAD